MKRIPHPTHKKVELSRQQTMNQLRRPPQPPPGKKSVTRETLVNRGPSSDGDGDGDFVFDHDFVYRVPNVLIATPVWQRHHIFEFWVERMKPLGCDILVVGSEGEKSQQLAEKHGLLYVEKANEPLGQKLNARAAYFLDHPQYTHLLLVGSDDILCPKAFRLIQTHIQNYDIVSWMDCYYYEWETGRIAYMSSFKGDRKEEPMAPGRCLSRRVIEHLGVEMWSSTLKRYPDSNLWKKLRCYKNQIMLSCKQNGCAVLDVKSLENLNSMDSLFKCKLAVPSDSIHVRHILKNIRVGENVVLGKNVQIGAGTVLGNNVEIRDNVSIGENCVLDSGTIVQKNAALENNTKLGPYVVVESNVKICEGVSVGPFSWVNKNITSSGAYQGQPVKKK